MISLAVFTIMIEQGVDASFCFLLYFYIGIFVIVPIATILTQNDSKRKENSQNKSEGNDADG